MLCLRGMDYLLPLTQEELDRLGRLDEHGLTDELINRAVPIGDYDALARIEIDTALARLGRSDYDVRLCLERAKTYLTP